MERKRAWWGAVVIGVGALGGGCSDAGSGGSAAGSAVSASVATPSSSILGTNSSSQVPTLFGSQSAPASGTHVEPSTGVNHSNSAAPDAMTPPPDAGVTASASSMQSVGLPDGAAPVPSSSATAEALDSGAGPDGGSCNSNCNTPGQSECTAGATRTCQLVDGCMRWSNTFPCANGCGGDMCAPCQDLPSVLVATAPLAPATIGADTAFVLANTVYFASSPLWAFDVSNPLQPKAHAANTVDASRGIAPLGQHVVALSLGKVSLLEVSDPDQPLELDSVAVDNGVALAGDGDVVYVGDLNGLGIYGLGPNDTLAERSVTPLAARPRGIAVQGGYAYLALEDDTFQIYDVSDVTDPSFANTWVPAGGGAVQSVVSGGPGRLLASIGDGANPHRVLSIANPTAPVLTETAGFEGQVIGDKAYQRLAGGLAVRALDGNYTVEAAYSSGSNFGWFTVSDRYAYCALGGEFQVLDLDALPRVVARSGELGEQASVSNGSLVYHTSPSGLQVMDFTDPRAPLQLKTVANNGGSSHPRALKRIGDRLYAAGLSGTTRTVRVFSLENPDAPQELAELTLVNGLGTELTAKGDTLVVNYASLYDYVYDISELSAPVYVTQGGAGGDSLLWYDDFLLETDATSTSVVSMQSPASPSVADSLGVGGMLHVRGTYGYIIGSSGITPLDLENLPALDDKPRVSDPSSYPSPNASRADTTPSDFSHYVLTGMGAIYSVTDAAAPVYWGNEQWPGENGSNVSHTINGYGVTFTNRGWLVVDRCH